MNNPLLEEKENRLFFRYLIPSMLSMLAVSAYSFVDTFVVGQALGAQAVAAMGLGTPVVALLYALGLLLGTGGGVSYSVCMSRGETEKARSIFSCSFFSALALWLVIAAAGSLRLRQFAVFLGATAGNLALTEEYLRWIISLSGFLILDLVMNSFMRNEGWPTVSMVATVTGTGLNIVLDFLFVMGFHWGMSGAASATCLASVVSVSINAGFAWGKKTNLIPGLKLGLRDNVLPMLRLGLGSFVLEGAVSVISVVFLNFAGRYYGDEGVSAFSVLITLNLVVYALLNGVAQALQPLVSANFGVGRQDRMRKFLRYGLLSSMALGLLFFAAAELLPRFLTGLFVTDSERILDLSVTGLRYHAVSFLLMSVSILTGVWFQSKTDSAKSLVILLGRSAVLPVAAVCLLAPVLPGLNVWISVPIGEAAAALIAVILTLRDRAPSA